MIYIIDEDVIQLRPYAMELEIRGYDVKQIDNADSAYNILTNSSDIELVLIDIMLATDNSEHSRYNREETNDFLNTGLLLIDDLCLTTPILFPKKLVIFSMGSQDWLVAKINKTASEKNIPFLRKRDYPSPYQFGNKIESILQQD